MPKDKCPNCHQDATSDTLKCGTCKLWVHRKCTGLAAEVYNSFAVIAKSGVLAYRCTCCLNAWTSMEERISSNAVEIAKLRESVSANSNTLAEHSESINTLKEDITVVKTTTTKMAETAAEAATKAATLEIAEVESRRNNIVIYRLEEPPKTMTDAKERKDKDMATIKEIMTVIDCPEATDSIVSSFRAGKASNNDKQLTHPLILNLDSNQIKLKILNSARKLADSRYSKISIQPDLTNNQRQREKDLWDEAELLNEELTSEEAKNFVWRPWGRPGAKKLRKMKIQTEEDSQRRKRRQSKSPEVETISQNQRKKGRNQRQ